MKKLKKICSKSSIKPELSHIHITDEIMEATDSFRYVQVKNTENIKAGFYHQKTGEFRDDMTFPDISVITNDLKNDLIIRVNKKYLIEVLEALEKGDSFDSVDIKINVTGAKNKPIMFENKNGFALVMPMNY